MRNNINTKRQTPPQDTKPGTTVGGAIPGTMLPEDPPSGTLAMAFAPSRAMRGAPKRQGNETQTTAKRIQVVNFSRLSICQLDGADSLFSRNRLNLIVSDMSE